MEVVMRYIILSLALFAFAAPATAQTAPRYHNSGTANRVSTPRCSDSSAPVAAYRPLFEFRYYPRGIPKAGKRSSCYIYYPYTPYNSSYPVDSGYNRGKSQLYPVR